MRMHVALDRVWYESRGALTRWGLGFNKNIVQREGKDDPGKMRLHCGEHRSRGQGNEPSFVPTLGEKSGGSVADGAILEVRGVA